MEAWNDQEARRERHASLHRETAAAAAAESKEARRHGFSVAAVEIVSGTYSSSVGLFCICATLLYDLIQADLIWNRTSALLLLCGAISVLDNGLEEKSCVAKPRDHPH